MEIINAGRQQGKTQMIINKAAEDGCPIIVATAIEKLNIIKKATDMQLSVTVYTFHELINLKGVMHNDDKVYVDNMEKVLQAAIGYTIAGATCSIPETKLD